MVPDVFDKKGTLPYFYLSWSSFHPTHHGSDSIFTAEFYFYPMLEAEGREKSDRMSLLPVFFFRVDHLLHGVEFVDIFLGIGQSTFHHVGLHH